MSVRSTSPNDTADGSGARVIRVTALDADGAKFSETVQMDGLTLVPTTTPVIDILPIGVVGHGSSPTNEGTITVENAGTVYEVIPLGLGRPAGGSHSAAYTVPLDHCAYVDRGFWSSGDQQGLFTVVFEADIPIIGRRSIPLSVENSAVLEIGICYPQGTHLEVLAKTDTGTAPITVTLRIVPVHKIGGRCP